MVVSLVGLALAYSACGHIVNAWTTPFADSHARKWVLSQRQHRAEHLRPFHERGLLHKLFGGTGTANNYSWKEEQFEIEVTIMVPPDTNAKDVKFKCSSNGIDLRLAGKEGAVEERILLDGKRTMRGKICVDGTFWSISDSDLSSLPKQYDASMPDSTKRQRQINIVIEKHFVPTSSVGGTLTYDQLTDFDWGGLYPDDEAEVSFRKYEEAEELNVKEYAAKLGVDIDNLDMSKVDKTMFGAGLREKDATASSDAAPASNGFQLNVTQSTLDQLVKSGLAKEIVRQGDGTEYELGTFSDGLERKVFSMLGNDVSIDELRDAGVVSRERLPDMWQKGSVPVEEVPGFRESDEPWRKAGDGIIEDEIVEENAVQSGAKAITDSGDESDLSSSATSEGDDDHSERASKDPIDQLTVTKLKDILRKEGLKVSGNKSELKERLREHVQLLLEDSS
ncbi:hypothetical protein HJC23_002709 [Cyclotella cryptica]|uniref:SAP domain-containing protein n=1 Tax=Cyclotella cryptica TaxID=29204 RepID=A0ABD3PBR2_9STRA